MDVNLERSKLVQRQKQQKTDLEKKVKKLKGAMKDAAAKELEELEAKHEAELAEFDGKRSGGAPAKATAAPVAPAAEKAPAASKDSANKFRERNWSGLSKKELEEECVLRGLGKKGSKEDLVQKLIIFHQDLATTAAEAGPTSVEAERSEEKPAGHSSDSETEEEESESESEDDGPEVEPEEMERQGKREKIMQKAIVLLLKEKCKEGFPLSEFEQKLEMVNVKNFAPEKCGYKSLEKFVKGQPLKVLKYDRKTQMILPPGTSSSVSA